MTRLQNRKTSLSSISFKVYSANKFDKGGTTMKKMNLNKKLAGASAMLLLSASMLGTSTYAWFTMSKEVEVNNIKMTATVPSDLQISLGEITDGSETNSLAKSTSVLATTSGAVKAPADQVDADPFDWSNTADVSKYYQFGKLIPASSTNGATVYYTADATGVGKTYNTGATSIATTDSATAHVNTVNTTDGWANGTLGYATEGAYAAAAGYSTTNDDGFYIDIPVWLRTSNKEATSVYVTGYISKDQSPETSDSDDLYQAVRVAILTDAGAANGGIVELNDGTAYSATQVATSLIDSAIPNAEWGTSGKVALSTAGTIAQASYGAVTVNNGTTSVATLAARTTAQYGAATKIIVRVWLEGEDGNCWNANAGQDWNISLKFMTEALPAASNNGGNQEPQEP
jgi:hypothetical protein